LTKIETEQESLSALADERVEESFALSDATERGADALAVAVHATVLVEVETTTEKFNAQHVFLVAEQHGLLRELDLKVTRSKLNLPGPETSHTDDFC